MAAALAERGLQAASAAPAAGTVNAGDTKSCTKVGGDDNAVHDSDGKAAVDSTIDPENVADTGAGDAVAAVADVRLNPSGDLVRYKGSPPPSARRELRATMPARVADSDAAASVI